MIRLKSVLFDDRVPQWHISRRVTPTPIIILIAHGSLNYEFENSIVPLSKGDFLIIPAGIVRSGSNGDFPHQKYAALFEFDPAVTDPLMPLIGNKGFLLFKPRNFEFMRQRFASLHRTWLEKSTFYDMICKGIVMEILGLVFEEIERQHIPSHKLLIANEMEKYIQLHFKEEIKIETLAKLVQRTPNYVTTIFKEIIGQSPIEYMHQIRIATAQDLLLHSNMNVVEVSDYLGFCDPSYFNRVFKKIMGQPPSVLLKRRG